MKDLSYKLFLCAGVIVFLDALSILFGYNNIDVQRFFFYTSFGLALLGLAVSNHD